MGTEGGKPPSNPGQRFGLTFPIFALLLAVIVSLGGWFYYQHEYVIALQTADDTLTSIADLKVKTIDNWMIERRGDTEVMRGSLMARSLLLNSGSADARQLAAARFDVWLKVYGYAAVIVTDSKGVVQMKEPADYPLPEDEITAHVQQALQGQQAVQVDLHRAASGEVYLWLSGQIFSQLQTNGPPDGVFISVVDPNRFLYPFVEKWPTPSKSAETVLVQRDGDSVVFLNPLRHAADAPLTLRFPIDATSQLPSVKMFRGDKDIAEGQVVESLDYRGVRVLAVTRWIPNTPWLMVTKVDKEEIFAPLRQEAWEIAIISALILAVIALSIGTLWRHQKLVYARANEARFRSLIEQAPTAISVSRGNHTLYVNQKYLDLYGLRNVEEAAECPLTEKWAPEFRNLIAQRIRQRARGEPVPNEFEGVCLRKDGSRFPVQLAVTSVELADGRASMAFITDITERKRATEEIEMLKFSIDKHFDGAYWMDTNNEFVYVNDTGCKNLGYTREELLGKPVTMVAPQVTPAALQGVWECLREKGFLRRESRHRRKDGSEFPVEIVATHVRFEGKEFNCSFARDITEQKRAQEELIWKTAFLEAQVDSTLDGILVVDDHAKKILQNQRLFQLFKIPEEIARDDDDAKLLQHVTQQTKDPKKFSERVAHLYAHRDETGRDEIELKDGTIVDRYSAPVCDKTGKYYGRIWAFREITEQRKLETQLRQSQKMEAIGQLASGVAHDFNNILAVIQMQADLMKTDRDISPANLEFANEIGIASQRAANLTRQLLMFSRKQAMLLGDIDLNDIVANITKMLQRVLREDIQMQFKYAPHPLFVHADAGMMDQVLMNLTVNARDAMPKGGNLFLETSVVTFDEESVAQAPQSRPGTFACLSVSDTGTGIPPEILPQIFNPFFSTKDIGKGTGLGLATVFGIVQLHQGWIDFQSQVGRGTTFRIYLPQLAGMPKQKPEPHAPAAVRGGDETILLVEDDAALCASVRKILSQLGYCVLDAVNGAEALKIWTQYGKDIHLLLTDLVMPGGMSGMDLGERLLKENPKLKVIYNSGYSAEVAGKDFALEEGVNFLTKPFEAQKLAQTVRQSLDTKIVV